MKYGRSWLVMESIAFLLTAKAYVNLLSEMLCSSRLAITSQFIGIRDRKDKPCNESSHSNTDESGREVKDNGFQYRTILPALRIHTAALDDTAVREPMRV